RELAQELERYLQGDVVVARPRTFWYLTQKLARRHWRKCLLAGSLVLAFVVSWVMIALYWRDAERAHAQVMAVNANLQQAYEREHQLRTDVEKSSDFLEKTFHVTMPQRKGAEIKLLDALQETKKMLAASFPEATRAQMLVRLALGRSFLRLNQPEICLDIIRPVMKIPEDSMDMATVLRWKAGSLQVQCLMQLRELDQAEAMCRDWLQREKRNISPEVWTQYVNIQQLYARLLAARKRHEQAIQGLRALEMEMLARGQVEQDALWALRNLIVSTCLEWQRAGNARNAEVLQLIQEYVQDAIRTLGPLQPIPVQLQSSLALSLHLQEKHDKAIGILQKMLRELEATYGDKNYLSQGILHNLVRIYANTGEIDLA
ncbi:MAG TPA: hypothetical protein PKA06_13660, partial [Gemmatales bacterium]|nr:hypothetical protein [Gemmatales bacterium]